MVAPSFLSRHSIGHERQGCSRAIDVVLHRGRPAQADTPDNFSVHLNGEPSSPRRHTRKRGHAGQKRRVALDEAEKILRGDAEQSWIWFIWAISMERIGAPSIRLKALRLPPSSRIVTFSRTPSSLAFATAASTIFCASCDLVGAEHWLLSDETPARDIESRRAFGNHIKGMAANSEVRTEIKFGHPVILRPFRRGTVSLNDEDENIRTLPPMDESIEDKLMIFKCNFVHLPLASGEAIEGAIASQLPGYVHYLLHEHEIREGLWDQRFGIKAYHHPVVLAALSATAPETQLLQEIDKAELPYKRIKGVWVWEGSSSDLQEILEAIAEDKGHSARARMASLIKHGNTCGTYLTRLANKTPDRVTKRRGDTRVVYRIRPPVGWNSKPVSKYPVTGEETVIRTSCARLRQQISQQHHQRH